MIFLAALLAVQVISCAIFVVMMHRLSQVNGHLMSQYLEANDKLVEALATDTPHRGIAEVYGPEPAPRKPRQYPVAQLSNGGVSV